MSHRLFPLLLLGSGCQCGPTPATDTPTHTGDSTADTAQPQVELVLELQAIPEAPVEVPLTLGVVHVSFGSLEDGPVAGDTIASSAASVGAVTLALPAVAPGEHAVQLSRQHGIGGSLYMLAAFEDSNQDGAFQEGEPLLGVAMDRWLLWRTTDCWECDTGLPVERWEVVDLGIAGQYEPNRCALDTSWPLEWMEDYGYPTYHDTGETITVDLRGVASSVVLEGSLVELTRDDLRLAVLPYPWLAHGEVQAAYEQDLPLDSEDFSVTLEQQPPAEDDVGSDPDWRYTMHLLLPYVDSDGSGSWTLADELEGSSSCFEGELAWARYTRAVSSYRGYRFLDCYSGNVGWRLAHYADHGGIEYLSSEQALQLALDFVDCRLD